MQKEGNLIITLESLHEEIVKNRRQIKNCIEASETKLLLSIEEARVNLRKLERENQLLKNEVEFLKRKQNKNNIIVFGLNKKIHNLTPEYICKDFKELLDVDLTERDLNDIYPLGRKENCPVKIGFVSHYTKKYVLQNCHKLKGKKISIAQDLTQQQRKDQEVLRRHLYQAKQEKTNKCYIRGDKLIVNGSTYSVEQLEQIGNNTTTPNSAPATPTVQHIKSPLQLNMFDTPNSKETVATDKVQRSSQSKPLFNNTGNPKAEPTSKAGKPVKYPNKPDVNNTEDSKMSLLIENSLALNILILLFTALFFKFYTHHCYTYWKRKGVPFLEAKFPLGNNTTFLPKGISVGIISKTFYDEFKKVGANLGGVYFGLTPSLVILDPDYIRDVLSKDFNHFVDRGVYQNERHPITVNLFSQPGIEWRNLRVKFTSTFTSAKMKMMFQSVVDCSKGFEDALQKFCRLRSDIDIREVAGCYTTDVIGSCVFGVECNSFKNPNADFRKFGKKVFESFTIWDQIKLFFTIYTPKLAGKLGVGNIQKDVSKFFYASIKDTVEYREKNNVYRQDFLQLLIELKNSQERLSMNELTAQVFLFFIAGFETSSTTMTMLLYEISKNETVQGKLREEIYRILAQHNGKLTYQAVSEMKFLDQCIYETLRLWPPVATVTRVCTKPYKFENHHLTLEKGVRVLIPVLGLQRDPEYWPDPLKWDPDRFSEANKENRNSFVYLPFGDGPRNCIGMRFGLMQTKIGLVTVLKNYKVSVSDKTITPLGMDPDTFVFHTINKVYLNLQTL